jgi:hypothetical protein
MTAYSVQKELTLVNVGLGIATDESRIGLKSEQCAIGGSSKTNLHLSK